MLMMTHRAASAPIMGVSRALGQVRCPENPGGCCPQGRCGCRFSADQVLSLLPSVERQLGSKPAWLALGWIAVESGGWPDCADCCLPSLGGELGPFQLSLDERRTTGFTDESRILFDVEYGVASGIALMDLYGRQVAALGVDPSDDPAWGYLVKFFHSIGSGAASQIVRRYTDQTGAPPTSATLDDFRSFAIGLGSVAGHSTAKWIGNADEVLTRGVDLAERAGVVSAPQAAVEARAISRSQAGRKVLVGLAVVGLVGAAAWAGHAIYKEYRAPARGRRRAFAGHRRR